MWVVALFTVKLIRLVLKFSLYSKWKELHLHLWRICSFSSEIWWKWEFITPRNSSLFDRDDRKSHLTEPKEDSDGQVFVSWPSSCEEAVALRPGVTGWPHPPIPTLPVALHSNGASFAICNLIIYSIVFCDFTRKKKLEKLVFRWVFPPALFKYQEYVLKKILICVVLEPTA